MGLTFTDDRKVAFEAILRPLAAFKHAFGRDATPGFIADLYAARQFNLTLENAVNAPGTDAIDDEGKRYQIKHRSPGVLNVDINNFDFDYIVLVNTDENYALTGMWRLTREQVQSPCVHREKFRKFQVRQARFKDEAHRCPTDTSA